MKVTASRNTETNVVTANTAKAESMFEEIIDSLVQNPTQGKLLEKAVLVYLKGCTAPMLKKIAQGTTPFFSTAVAFVLDNIIVDVKGEDISDGNDAIRVALLTKGLNNRVINDMLRAGLLDF